MADKMIKITKIKSEIGYRQRAKDTLIALGLKKMNSSVIKQNNEAIRGMLAKVRHLIKVEEV